jgi:hypothetical protein
MRFPWTVHTESVTLAGLEPIDVSMPAEGAHLLKLMPAFFSAIVEQTKFDAICDG